MSSNFNFVYSVEVEALEEAILYNFNSTDLKLCKTYEVEIAAHC